MKKIFLATGVLIAIAIKAANAQYYIEDDNVKVMKSVITNTPNEIPKEGGEGNQNAVSESTRNQFIADFPDAANIRFKKTNDFNEVSYSLNGRDMTAYYDFNNQLVGTINYQSFGNLPANAQAKILDDYPNYKVVKVLRFNVNSDNESYIENDTYMTLYGNSFDKSNNYFVELKSDHKAIVLEVDLSGEVSYFTAIK